jgi:ketosteroid isomerase-like protein
MPETHASAKSIVDAYYHAWTNGDVDQAMSYLSDQVRCYAPDESVTTKDDWQHYLARFVPMLTAAPEHARMADGNRVALWYFPQTALTRTTLASELFTVEGGQITEIHLAFDRLGYMPREGEAG